MQDLETNLEFLPRPYQRALVDPWPRPIPAKNGSVFRRRRHRSTRDQIQNDESPNPVMIWGLVVSFVSLFQIERPRKSSSQGLFGCRIMLSFQRSCPNLQKRSPSRSPNKKGFCTIKSQGFNELFGWEAWTYAGLLEKPMKRTCRHVSKNLAVSCVSSVGPYIAYNPLKG